MVHHRFPSRVSSVPGKDSVANEYDKAISQVTEDEWMVVIDWFVFIHLGKTKAVEAEADQ